MEAGTVVAIVIALVTYILGLYTAEVRGSVDRHFGSRRETKRQRRFQKITKRISLIESLVNDPARLIAYVMPPVILTLILLGCMVAILVALIIGEFHGKNAASVFFLVILFLCIFLSKFSIDLCEDVAHADERLSRLRVKLSVLGEREK